MLLKYSVGDSPFLNGRGSIDDQGRVYDTEYPGGYPMAIGLVDQDGYVYGKYPPLSRGIGSPDLIGRVDLGTGRVISTLSGGGYDMAGEIGYMDDNGEVRLRNGYGPVGYVEPADPRGAAAILLLLMNPASVESAAGAPGESEDADAGSRYQIAGDPASGARVLMAIVPMLSTVFIGSWAFILGAVVFLVYTLVSNAKQDNTFRLSNLTFKRIVESTVFGVIVYMAECLLLILFTEGLMGLFIKRTPDTIPHAIIAAVLFGIAAAVDYGFKDKTDSKTAPAES